ncbi:hypothetical protein BJ138DRAFT_1126184 [Hygrophoropsis aurantiaca]|uniref:Uncharacterized protein n=1 Tax=Hygrophoropsis aurantiaca TaxID=72124 RepID=A0ACB8ADD3_9AGAM|nr:hypothetical protein BJ138DRAFT_1126184 [Hygrophoropsis aurantiaca]
MPRILFVSGFHPSTRARDLAYEFERFGPLVRCDVPAPRNPHASSNPRIDSRDDFDVLQGDPAYILRTRAFSSIRSSTREYIFASDFRNILGFDYAFVEFRSQRDAEDAYYDMHGKYFEGSRLSIQWAKNPPSSVWRYERRTSPPHRSSRAERERSRSPRRRVERDERDTRDREPERDARRRRSRSPERRRSASPTRRREDRARTPPMDDLKKDDERDRAQPQTPPYEH